MLGKGKVVLCLRYVKLKWLCMYFR